MDKKTRDFIEETTDLLPIPTGSFLHRERAPNGMYFMTLRLPNGDSDFALEEWWKNPNKPAKKDKDPPKHTGGKQPYVMLMTKEVEKLGKEGVKNVAELVGHLSLLGDYIEWNTGKLINKRTKKPLKYKEVLTIFKCGNKKLNRLLKDMKEYELIFATDSGYCVSPRFVKKGRTKKQEGN
ncbi:MAG TPA: hypothetical protein DCX03_00885 [Bacteroidales bacterium]|jgi:hypothetical protein|nr:hypothetical protein [Bacteroidales bacterium]